MNGRLATGFAATCMILLACGKAPQSETRLLSRIQTNDFIVETFQVSTDDQAPSADELKAINATIAAQQEAANEATKVAPGLPDRRGVLEDATGDRIDTVTRIINAFADIMKKVVAPDTPLMKGNVIAEARPEGLQPIDLQNSKYAGKTFKKRFKSLMGFTLVETEYKITYAYAADNNGKGQYIPYVLFTPMKIVLDPLWHLEADSLSLAPRNSGTLGNPIAALEFNLAFKAKGLTGTVMAADTFSLNAQTGELVFDGRDFQP
jgi:hypothetical protein